MSNLIIAASLPAADEFYDELIAAHEGFNKSRSDAFNARLILLLANHIGDRQVLSDAIAAARRPEVERSVKPFGLTDARPSKF